MSKIISQNDYDSKQITDSIRYFFERFHLSAVLKASNAKKSKGATPLKIMSYASMTDDHTDPAAPVHPYTYLQLLILLPLQSPMY